MHGIRYLTMLNASRCLSELLGQLGRVNLVVDVLLMKINQRTYQTKFTRVRGGEGLFELLCTRATGSRLQPKWEIFQVFNILYELRCSRSSFIPFATRSSLHDAKLGDNFELQ